MFTDKTFSLTDEDYEKIRKWYQSHKCLNRDEQTAIGAKLSIIFTPSSIGTFSSVRCACGEFLQAEDGANF